MLQALTLLALAEQALAEKRYLYVRELLNKMELEGCYCAEKIQRRRLLLSWQAGVNDVEPQLPDLSAELLLRAEAVLATDPAKCAAYLACVTEHTPHYHYMKAQMHFAEKAYADARPHFEAAWDHAPVACCRCLEDCCREMEDFAGAYFYACKLRELTG